jgi:hypothetical protein
MCLSFGFFLLLLLFRVLGCICFRLFFTATAAAATLNLDNKNKSFFICWVLISKGEIPSYYLQLKSVQSF